MKDPYWPVSRHSVLSVLLLAVETGRRRGGREGGREGGERGRGERKEEVSEVRAGEGYNVRMNKVK